MAYLNGPATGSNTFIGAATYSFMEGAGYTNLVYNFATVNATSAAPRTT